MQGYAATRSWNFLQSIHRLSCHELRDSYTLLTSGKLLTMYVAIVHTAHNAPRYKLAQPAMPLAKRAVHLKALMTAGTACESCCRG